MFYTDDPLMDFARHDAQQTKELESRPVCADCQEHIQEETAFYIEEKWICENCIDSYRREVMPE